jgi:type I restriction enzyme S subunit
MTQIDLLKAGATIQHFGPTHLGQIFVVRPPISEQEVVASFLKESCSKMDSLVSEKQSLIETLKEYRTSLIHEAVTGKIDLRNA